MLLNDCFMKFYNRYLQEICRCYGPSPPVTAWWPQWPLCFPPLGEKEPPHQVGGRAPGIEGSLASVTAPYDHSVQWKVIKEIYIQLHNETTAFPCLVNLITTPQSFVWGISGRLTLCLPQSNYLCNIKADWSEVIRLDRILKWAPSNLVKNIL